MRHSPIEAMVLNPRTRTHTQNAGPTDEHKCTYSHTQSFWHKYRHKGFLYAGASKLHRWQKCRIPAHLCGAAKTNVWSRLSVLWKLSGKNRNKKVLHSMRWRWAWTVHCWLTPTIIYGRLVAPEDSRAISTRLLD